MARPHFRFLPGFRGLFFKVWVSGRDFGFMVQFIGSGFLVTLFVCQGIAYDNAAMH